MKWYRFGVVAAIALGACDPGIDAHVEPGSRADSLVFHAFMYPDSLRGGKSISAISVVGCRLRNGTRPMYWKAERRQRTFTWLQAPETRFRYGRLPESEWRVVHVADSLKPGCYRADLPGAGVGGTTWFVVHGDGSVTNADTAPAAWYEREPAAQGDRDQRSDER